MRLGISRGKPLGIISPTHTPTPGGSYPSDQGSGVTQGYYKGTRVSQGYRGPGVLPIVQGYRGLQIQTHTPTLKYPYRKGMKSYKREGVGCTKEERSSDLDRNGGNRECDDEEAMVIQLECEVNECVMIQFGGS
ncbi:uncharacterized protein HD556DRAFT_1307001 [Suillus plorans]|uniref:Uncharacterized protein n=1 Tax=Suillus plorans TaxID=116603 RepID=A0A9P7AW84_9AGAM|nr:uncharacterized protein HD556DRAFT_1307001 [Suillus plorans]KAG1796239.1 hypothetical protein HD556DRAFT_1307001 [Suillus plorans]